MVFRQFPIHLDPRSSPSEKISKNFEIYYRSKRVEVLPSKLLSSDFGQSECGSKNPWRSWTSHLNFSGGPIGTSWTSQKKFGVWGPSPLRGPGTLQMPHLGHLGGPGPPIGWGPQTPKFFWEVQEVPIGPPEKIKWLVQLFHGFFWATCDWPKSLLGNLLSKTSTCLVP